MFDSVSDAGVVEIIGYDLSGGSDDEEPSEAVPINSRSITRLAR